MLIWGGVWIFQKQRERLSLGAYAQGIFAIARELIFCCTEVMCKGCSTLPVNWPGYELGKLTRMINWLSSCLVLLPIMSWKPPHVVSIKWALFRTLPRVCSFARTYPSVPFQTPKSLPSFLPSFLLFCQKNTNLIPYFSFIFLMISSIIS